MIKWVLTLTCLVVSCVGRLLHGWSSKPIPRGEMLVIVINVDEKNKALKDKIFRGYLIIVAPEKERTLISPMVSSFVWTKRIF